MAKKFNPENNLEEALIQIHYIVQRQNMDMAVRQMQYGMSLVLVNYYRGLDM